MSSSGVVTRLHWALGTMQPGATVHLQFKVTVDAVAGTTTDDRRQHRSRVVDRYTKPTQSNPVHNPVSPVKVLPHTGDKPPATRRRATAAADRAP